MIPPYVYDAGVLIAADNNDRRTWARHKIALTEARDIHVPAVVVAQAWRDSRRQVALSGMLAGCQVHPVGLETSKAAGVLCGKSGISDVADATVVVMAAAMRAIIWTTDPRDLATLAAVSGALPRPEVRAV